MSNQVVVTIDNIHCRAICDEVGERLRLSYLRVSDELPIRLRNLLDRLRQQELEDAPSIVPSDAELSAPYDVREADPLVETLTPER
jgi:hypothetical protein